MNDVTERCGTMEAFDDALGEAWPYTISECDLKQLEENARFAELARQELAAQRKDNFWRQERRNVSLQARGNNHDRKVHCARIKARKWWS